MTGSPVSRILIIDDNDVDRKSIIRHLRGDFEIWEAATAAAGLSMCRELKPDCVLLDYYLPDATGLAVLTKLLALNTVVVMLTGQGDESVAVTSLQAGATDYLPKRSLSKAILRRSIQGALKNQALAKRLEMFQTLVERSPLGVLVLNSEPESLECHWSNDAFRKDFGFDITENETLLSQFPALRNTELPAACRDAAQAGISQQIRNVDIQGAPHDVHLVPLGPGRLALLSENTSARKELEAHLVRAQKEDVVGRLAGGIAHDFNNLLTVILIEVANLQEQTQRHKDDAKSLAMIEDVAERATGLTRRLLSFSRHRVTQNGVVDLAKVVRGMERLLHRVLGEDLVLELNLVDEPTRVRCDETQLEQVLLNLATNARQAMPRGGTLTIETTTQVRPSPRAGQPPIKQVGVTVRDTGHGMDDETQARIFEPFFTTRVEGHGTGLGLATVHSVITQAGGSVSAHSVEGEGTTFTILLPLVTQASEDPIAAPNNLPKGTGQRILLVEDEVSVRTAAAGVLSRAGYKVHTAEGPTTAVRMAGRSSYDLLLTDVIMPAMSGTELATEVQTLQPDVRVLFMTGYSEDTTLQHNLQHQSLSVLLKPFSPMVLLQRVSAVLDSQTTLG